MVTAPTDDALVRSFEAGDMPDGGIAIPIFERYYTPDTLWSERARRTFVMPDRLA